MWRYSRGLGNSRCSKWRRVVSRGWWVVSCGWRVVSREWRLVSRGWRIVSSIWWLLNSLLCWLSCCNESAHGLCEYNCSRVAGTITRTASTAAASHEGNHNGGDNQTADDNTCNGCASEAMSTNQLTGVIRIATLIRITLPTVRARVAVFSTLAIRAFLLTVATPTAFSSSTLVTVRAIVAPLSTNAIFTTTSPKVRSDRRLCRT